MIPPLVTFSTVSACASPLQFNTLVTVTKQLISTLSGVSIEDLKTKRIDEGGIDGDLCCVVNTPDLAVVAVVWPTAGRLKQLKTLADNTKIGSLLIVNPLWKTEGQIMSEFGIGPWRVENEKFVASFENSYSLYEQRIGSPSSVNLARGSRYESGGVVRIQRSYPSGFEVHLMAPNGSSQALGTFDAVSKPAYQALEKLIQAGRDAKLEIFEVARSSSRLELERGPAKQESESSSASSEFHSREEILNMDLSKLRRVLVNLNLPTSGSLTKLQARALAVADSVEAGEDLESGVAAAKLLR